MKVLDFPLVKITISFIIGILASYYWRPAIIMSLIMFCCFFILFGALYFLTNSKNKLNLFFGISTSFLSFFAGVIILFLHTESNQNTNYSHLKTGQPLLINFTLREKLKSNDYNDRYIGIINNIENKNYSGKIIVNVRKDSTVNSLILGSVIRAKTILQYSKPIKNPNQFDYGRYLADKQIYAQVYLQKSEIQINKTLEKDIWYYCGRLHASIVKNLEKAHFHKEEMNVALALILGQQQEISPDIIQDYQFSGATHVLSVSGLHVGFIMLFINFILRPIPNTRKGSALKLACVLFSLASFAVISGLSPSVLRSVVMFSFVAIGSYLRRGGNIYHTLLVSILLILLFEPYFLFDVGFQLSYLALFFIVWLQPLLKKIWSPKNKLILYIWDTLTVSFAAQIGTLPLCLYYFHQFPGLFFVTNIIILPVLSFIMIAGIIVMIIAIFTSPPLFLVEIFEKSIFILNKMTHVVASFESFVIRDISFNTYYLFSFYFFIIAVVLWLKTPKYNKLVFVLGSLILIQLSAIYTKKEIAGQQELIIYNTKQQSLISERKGNTIRLFASDTLFAKNKQNQVLTSYLTGNFAIIKKTDKLKNTIFFNGQKILIIDSTAIFETKIQPDIILLIQSPKINLDRILTEIHPKTIVADASNSYAVQKCWKKSCFKKNIPFHSISEKGYFKIN
ncbi:ComEC/Rec2 family competence protein [Flavobacterium reichenbachii]|uniref:Competence protein ComEC n=1 Tax=Flavobacterium reichenbachii TaxID=362418 RepID=A0A085ZRI8_9FLAO|nr:ComEC/Rec2 family competence protein [Flavobacterium reichenbachii]KFF07052.1 competence protein ComEC [Flavobacterium reichenbachii]OXB11978.1 competence protein ComEC [Flavobacterium reichenbachii]